MSGNKTLINILISVVVIVAGFFAYVYFRPAPATTSETGLIKTPSDLARPLDPSDEFLTTLLNLKKIEFKTEVFQVLGASQLKDFTTELSPQTPGRPNPFAPVGSDARTGTVFVAPSASSTSSTTKAVTPAKKTPATTAPSDSLFKALNS